MNSTITSVHVKYANIFAIYILETTNVDLNLIMLDWGESLFDFGVGGHPKFNYAGVS